MCKLRAEPARGSGNLLMTMRRVFVTYLLNFLVGQQSGYWEAQLGFAYLQTVHQDSQCAAEVGSNMMPIQVARCHVFVVAIAHCGTD